MSTGIEEELRAAFEAASKCLEPPRELAGLVRAGARKRRRRMALSTMAAACALVIGAAAATYLVASRPDAPAVSRRSHTARVHVPTGEVIGQLAAAGPYLYVLPSQGDRLAAYNLATGKIVRQVRLPGTTGGFAIGPGGMVWVPFSGNTAADPHGIWLMSRDLRRHSALLGEPMGVITPVSRTTAWATDHYGLIRLSLPTPGSNGPASWSRQPGTSIGPPVTSAPGRTIVIDGQVVVDVTDGGGFHSHLIIAGEPEVTYGGGPLTTVYAAAAAGGSLWVISGPDASNSVGAVIRLNSHLRPTTPSVIRRSRILSQVAGIWSHGGTVWVELGPRGWADGHSLACFRADSRIGPVVTLPVSGQVVALAATASSVYVTAALSGRIGIGVSSYSVPAACR